MILGVEIEPQLEREIGRVSAADDRVGRGLAIEVAVPREVANGGGSFPWFR